MRGKVKRTIAQFSPHSWTNFEWAAVSSPKRFAAVLFLVVVVASFECSEWTEQGHSLFTVDDGRVERLLSQITALDPTISSLCHLSPDSCWVHLYPRRQRVLPVHC